MKQTTLITPALFFVALLVLYGSNLEPVQNEQSKAPAEYQLYFGDLHNHNSIGQIKGSLKRTFEVARSHLDFFSFTPQSQWYDMREIPQGRNEQFERGFQAVRKRWDEIQQRAREFYQPGNFVPLIGYEIHANAGDFHILFPGSFGELAHLNSAAEWQQFAKKKDAILIPHHPGYKPGWRGHDWDLLDPTVSPVLEIYSEHGNAESDRAPKRYIRHSMGGRYTRSTAQALWERGEKLGVVASSDDHLGFPGAYGQGLAAIWARSLTREGVMEALRARRTYGVSADRIQLTYRLNGQWMGETVAFTTRRGIEVGVEGEDVVDRVEVLRNNQVIYRDHPVDRQPSAESWKEPVLCRIEFGWGPWADFNMPRTCDWDFEVEVENGTILSVSPHFQSRPFDENRRHQVSGPDNNSVRVVSYTSRQNSFEDKPTNDIVLKLQGSARTVLRLKLKKPTEEVLSKRLGELAQSNDIVFTGPFSSESVMVHRLVFAENYQTNFDFVDERDGSGDWYYVRVTQSNGSLAWSSPIWIGKRQER